MSMILMAKAMSIKVGNPTRKLVLLKLADNANDSGKCWPSYDHIAEMCEIDRRTAMRHIKALSESGLVTLTYRKGEKGNSSNIYHLHLDGDNLSPPSDTRSPRVVSEDHQPSDPVSPRTSHRTSQLEPVKNIKKSLVENSEIPEELNLVAWQQWLEYRATIKKKYKTQRGELTGIAKLLELSRNDKKLQQRIIDQSIDNEWQGLFELKTNTASRMNEIAEYSPELDASQFAAPKGY